MTKKDSNAWMQTLWRPMMGWMYMIICLLDMAVFPVLWALWQGINHTPITQWSPLTLQGAGLFHIAMGAVLGISAFGRTQEKLAGTAANPTTTQTITQNNNPSSIPASGFGGFGNGNTTIPSTAFQGGSTAFGSSTTGGFGSSGGAGSPAPSTSVSPTPNWGTTPISTGFGGKKVVPDAEQPLI